MSHSSSNYENNISLERCSSEMKDGDEVIDINLVSDNSHRVTMSLTEIEVCLISKFRSLDYERQKLVYQTAFILLGDKN